LRKFAADKRGGEGRERANDEESGRERGRESWNVYVPRRGLTSVVET